MDVGFKEMRGATGGIYFINTFIDVLGGNYPLCEFPDQGDVQSCSSFIGMSL